MLDQKESYILRTGAAWPGKADLNNIKSIGDIFSGAQFVWPFAKATITKDYIKIEGSIFGLFWKEYKLGKSDIADIEVGISFETYRSAGLSWGKKLVLVITPNNKITFPRLLYFVLSYNDLKEIRNFGYLIKGDPSKKISLPRVF